jgi:hypothetical protein
MATAIGVASQNTLFGVSQIGGHAGIIGVPDGGYVSEENGTFAFTFLSCRASYDAMSSRSSCINHPVAQTAIKAPAPQGLGCLRAGFRMWG